VMRGATQAGFLISSGLLRFSKCEPLRYSALRSYPLASYPMETASMSKMFAVPMLFALSIFCFPPSCVGGYPAL